ncbi:tetratricopeptide repeat protein [Thermodesulfobacteriota bacterium]
MAKQKKKTRKSRPTLGRPYPRTKPNSQPRELERASDLFGKNNFKEAEAILHKILQKKPNHGQALALLGNLRNKQGNNDAAITCLEKATSLLPNDPAILYNLGVFLQENGRDNEALNVYRKTLRHQPNHTKALNNLGTLLQSNKDFDGAIEIFKKIITSTPDQGSAYLNLGEIYGELGEFETAIEYYRQGLRLIPDSKANLINLGVIYKITHRLTMATETYKKALQLDPSDIIPYCNIGSVLIAQGELEEALKYLHKALKIDSTHEMVNQNHLMALNYPHRLSAEEIFAKHREWGQQIEQRLKEKRTTLHRNPIDHNRRLRIGYVSADFGEHAVANFIEPILASHNRKNFEIFCYANVEYPDKRTARLRKSTEHWRDIYESDDEKVAAIILADSVDILVDLSGHTAKNRLSLFARKPAPIQVTYLGYPNTTGLTTMDYRFTDSYADPAGTTEHRHTETLLRLPQSFLCYGPPSETLPINEPPVLHNGYITFASFNNRPKVTDTVIACWAQILHKVANSRLLLKSMAFRDEPTRTRLVEKFAGHGIEPNRLDIREPVPRQAGHMQLYNQADIALDTFPYNGTTTTFEALWMGVPVITLAGETHVSRVSTSILNQIDGQDCIANNQEEYIKLAATLAGNTERLTTLRKELRQRLRDSPACNSRQFTQNLENAYRTMAENWNQKIAQSTQSPENATNNSQANQDAAIQLNKIGEQLFGNNKINEATQIFQEAIEISPYFDVAHNNLGVALWQQGHTHEAMACFQKALQINPTSVDAIDNLTAVLKAMSKTSGQTAEQTPESLIEKGESYFAAGDIRSARELFKKVLTTAPVNPTANNNLGIIYWQEGEITRAEQAFKTALTFAPENKDFLNNFHAFQTGQPEPPTSSHLTKPTIKIIHHLARSGGTVISKCIGCMKDVIMLSEIHPLGRKWFNPLNQASKWFNLFTPQEHQEIQQAELAFAEVISLIAERCAQHQKHLVIRDWTHLDYTGVPFLPKPTNQLFTYELLKEHFPIKRVTTVRHPIDQWLSLSRLGIMQGHLDLNSYLAGFKKFAEECLEIGFIRYEDFTKTPEEKTQELCNLLSIPYDPAFIGKWWSYETITGDTNSKRGATKEINPVPRYPVADEIIKKFATNQDYLKTISMLGYEHPKSTGTKAALNSNALRTEKQTKRAHKINENLLAEFLTANAQFWDKFTPTGVTQAPKTIMVELLVNHIGYIMGNCIIAKYLQKRLDTKLIGILPSKSNPEYKLIRAIVDSYGFDDFIDIDYDIGFRCNIDISRYTSIKGIKAQRAEVINTEFDDVQLGDLAYDAYLRETGKGTIDVINEEVLNMLAEVIRDFLFYDTLIKQQNVVATVQGHTVYRFGAMARAALKNGADVYGKKPAGNPLTVRKYTRLDEKRQYEFRLTKDEFAQLLATKKEFAINAGRRMMEERLSGANTSEFSGAFGVEKKIYDCEEIVTKFKLAQDKPTICIMSHIFPDAPHAFESSLYNDYYEWLEETLLAIKDITDVNWLIKEHPHLKHYNPKHSATTLATPFVERYPHIHLTPEDLNTKSLLPAVDAIVTCSGTAGLEFSTQGIPCILAGESHYSGFGFTIEPKTKQEYLDQLKNIGKLKKLPRDKIDLSLAYAYAFFKLVRVKCDLLPGISDRFFDKEDFTQILTEAIEILQRCTPETDAVYINFNRQLDSGATHLMNFDVFFSS